MKFLDDNFLLTTDLAVELYNDYAKDMPIIDYHSHLNPQEIATDKKFSSITELWLSGDHYKWRLMRNAGISEEYITGDASDREKFKKFASVLPLCIGNPIYIWCHLELKKYFDCTLVINPDTANQIFDLVTERLKDKDFSAKSLITRSNVVSLCTTDDPLDSLEWHKKIAESQSTDPKAKNLPSNLKPFTTSVLPTYRPDKALNIKLKDFSSYIKKLTGNDKPCIDDIKQALVSRLDYFAENGCYTSDHGIEKYSYLECSLDEANSILQKVLAGGAVLDDDAEKYLTHMLTFLGAEYAKRDIAMQLHFNVLRNTNSKMFKLLGADSGYDCINSSSNPIKLIKLLDCLESKNALPKTIIYSLDASDNKLINSIINSFQSKLLGKVQHGSAWWFNDTRFGMHSHLKTLAEYSVLGNFIGMLTDSRSFTSYTRHDYFRRILCDLIAQFVLDGEYPSDKNALKSLIEGICFYNAKRYFDTNSALIM